MSFGTKSLDDSYDKWVTQTPEEYFGTERCPECGECVHPDDEECSECGCPLQESEEE